MKIVAIETRTEAIPLARPYTITFRTVTAIETVIVVVRDSEGRVGLGAASPEHHVTGETNLACQQALAPEALAWLIGRDLRGVPALARLLEQQMSTTPGGARAPWTWPFTISSARPWAYRCAIFWAALTTACPPPSPSASRAARRRCARRTNTSVAAFAR